MARGPSDCSETSRSGHGTAGLNASVTSAHEKADVTRKISRAATVKSSGSALNRGSPDGSAGSGDASAASSGIAPSSEWRSARVCAEVLVQEEER